MTDRTDFQTPPRRDEVEAAKKSALSFMYTHAHFAPTLDTLLTALSAAEGDVKRMDYLVARTHITESFADQYPIAQMDESGPRLPNGAGDLRAAIDAEMAIWTPGAGE